jgi:hypothetical protein
MFQILKQVLVLVILTAQLFIITSSTYLVDTMVTTGMIYTGSILLQINGLKLEEMDSGLKVDIEHQQLLWDSACIYLVVTMAQDN